ncbi:hypothetical protein [Leekyejoonella antrihumi]|uniref:Uncharacterized protein n=1 Tax=Leekyejoonella antrihumi TaxID=1660198 RepID=A0A563DSG1_9MICO|nr:hypothetical protein [Leekyejoonella antrihumi]TWP33187.1 hypothetical protein FGL98_22215 [Leekyejoonella antrihumi]
MSARTCPRCGKTITSSGRGRPPTWCSQACRRAAYEERRAAASGAIAVRIVTKEAPPTAPPKVSIDEHVAAVIASPTACARVLAEVATLKANGQIQDPRWARVKTAVDQLIAAGQVPANLHWIRSAPTGR